MRCISWWGRRFLQRMWRPSETTAIDGSSIASIDAILTGSIVCASKRCGEKVCKLWITLCYYQFVHCARDIWFGGDNSRSLRMEKWAKRFKPRVIHRGSGNHMHACGDIFHSPYLSGGSPSILAFLRILLSDTIQPYHQGIPLPTKRALTQNERVNTHNRSIYQLVYF